LYQPAAATTFGKIKPMSPVRFTRKKMMLMLLLCLSLQYCQAAGNAASQKSLNFYIFTKDASSKFDLFGTTALLRAKKRGLFSQKTLFVIEAENTQQVVNEMIAVLGKYNAVIGNIWIDAHGLYKQGYSSFHIGADEYSYKNINDSCHTSILQQLVPYSNDNTTIGIGSCYGGATFYFPGSATVPCGRMNGDSLMTGLGRIFARATIYGSESWVMAKPGIFNDNFGFAGYPLGKRYRNTYWQPVWERLGQWNRYRAATGIFEPVNTVALNKKGEITVRSRHYQELNKGQKAIEKNLARLD
jgi:hypothetical protein